MTKEELSRPTAYLESIMLTSTIDAKEEREVMTMDIPNAFIQTQMERKENEDRVIMKITGIMVEMLIQLAPDLYGPKVVYQKGRKVLYVEVLRAIYGMLQSALLFYKKFWKDLEKEGFKFNPYNPCVANQMVNGEQLTVVFHVDDAKVSHKDKKVIDDFHQWADFMYGDPKIGAVTATRGPIHDYLGMTLDFSTKIR